MCVIENATKNVKNASKQTTITTQKHHSLKDYPKHSKTRTGHTNTQTDRQTESLMRLPRDHRNTIKCDKSY